MQIEALMRKEQIEYEQACYCLKITGYQSVEAASLYLNQKNANGKLTHTLVKLGALCAVCEKPLEIHADYTHNEDSPMSVKLSSNDAKSVERSYFT